MKKEIKNTNKITINGIDYIPASEVKNNIKLADNKKGLTFSIIRTYSAGVWAGWLDLKKIDKIMNVKEGIRLYSWYGEFTLSAIAIKGLRQDKLEENKFDIAVPELYLTEIIEIIPCSEIAKNQIINHPTTEFKN